MKVGLFIPCYVDQFYPKCAIATLELLEGLGLDTEYPLGQTCCGQPMANAGYSNLSGSCSELFSENFSRYDYIVSPSGSCVLHIKEHVEPTDSHRIFELTEFLTDVIEVKTLNATFPHKVGLHQSCHGQRGLNLSQMTERVGGNFSKPAELLSKVKGLQLISLDRADECCGFGGTFCVTEEAVSVKMGKDRVADHALHGAEFITGSDMSCLMHMEGILKRQKSNIKVLHIAEILNSK